uniref:Uncharacterized protein n=1 Tax=Heliothis virescens TaxID=7102 RepID=A0A2A4JFV4_HELVI
MIDKIQEQYKNSAAYELGLLAAGIMDKFKHMITVYRYFSDIKIFKDDKLEVYDIMNGYSIMQSDYNQIIIEREMYLQILAVEMEKQVEEERIIADYHARNPHIPLQAIKDARAKGMTLPGMRSPKSKSRRAMTSRNVTTKPGAKNKIKMSKRNAKNWAKNITGTEEAEYKRRLRYMMWAERWNGFNPEIEGVYIPDPIAKVGLANASNFLSKELKGDF